MSSPQSLPHDGTQVAIIGGGLGGIASAIALKTQLHCDDFMIYEKAADYGGVWRDNIYPGSACDTPTHWYTLSSHLFPDCPSTHAPQPVLLEYWLALAEKYDLRPQTTFHALVRAAVWDESSSRYVLTVEDVNTGKRTNVTARAVISATGILDTPKIPNLKGMRVFAGPMFHSARWRWDVPLRGKRVAVIGNGASAAQIIPMITSDPTVHVVNFCRSPNWFIYEPRGLYSRLQRWMFVNIPLFLRIHRLWVIFMRIGLPYLQRYWQMFITRENKTREQALAEYIKRKAPVKYHSHLIPDYPVHCRRPILDAGYLACLHRPNVHLNWDGISEITRTGIRTNKGAELPFDVIILSTGYVTNEHSYNVVGRDGQTLDALWLSHGGPIAYLGITVPGFPNFFLIGGPNTVTSNGSAVFTHEIEVNYIVQLIRRILHSPRLAVEVKASVFQEYNARLYDALSTTSYKGCPPSWFRSHGGVGRNTSLFPWTHFAFWWILRRVQWEVHDVSTDVNVVGGGHLL